MYKPELINSLKGYNGKQFLTDFIAGIIVGIVALPLSIAFAIASGCSPETGLYTAIVAGFCIAAFGGTRCQIGGPTGAFTVIIYAIVNKPELGTGGLALAAVLAGIMLIFMGVLKLGGLVKFIPYTIVVGFTAGIAVVIASGQIGDFFGMAPDFKNGVTVLGETFHKMPGEFHQKIGVYAQSLSTINIYATVMAVVCLVIIFLWPKVTKKIPGSLVVIILATIAVVFFQKYTDLRCETIASKFGVMNPEQYSTKYTYKIIPQDEDDKTEIEFTEEELLNDYIALNEKNGITVNYETIPHYFCAIELLNQDTNETTACGEPIELKYSECPVCGTEYDKEFTISSPRIDTSLFTGFSFDKLKGVFGIAISIAILAAIESLLSAVVADGMIGAKHDSNNELIGQGIANIFSPLFGGLPATGAIARTATNINNGGRTPVAGIIHAIVLLLIVLFFSRFVGYIPIPALAAVLMSVAWNMAGIPAIRKLLKGQKSDIAVLTVTFLITVFVDLTYAIGVGLILAAFFFIKKIIDLSEVQTGNKTIVTGISGDGSKETIDLPKNVMVYEIEGSLFFGTVRKFEYAVERAGSDCKAIIFRMRNLIYLDAGGLQALEQAKQACDRKGITIILSGIHTQPYMLCEKTGMADKIGRENIFDNINGALARASEISSK